MEIICKTCGVNFALPGERECYKCLDLFEQEIADWLKHAEEEDDDQKK